MDTIISVKNLRKVYRLGGEKVVALNDINLDIKRGEVCCILGTSGSGKSTLLNQLAGLEKPSKGAVYIGKNNISKFSENRLAGFRQKNIGFIFQSYNLLSSMTALENVSLPLMFRGTEKSKREKEAAYILKQVGLSGRMKHRPSQMSGGQQQRVGIARAFVAKPKIVFADEPTGNLDSKTTIEVMELMVRMCRENNQTLILVTHDRELAEYADRIVTLLDGNIVTDETNISKIDREKAMSNLLKTADQDEQEQLEIKEEIKPQESVTEENTADNTAVDLEQDKPLAIETPEKTADNTAVDLEQIKPLAIETTETTQDENAENLDPINEQEILPNKEINNE